MRYFFAKSLIVNQIRLFRLFPPFSLFERIRLLDFPALIQIHCKEICTNLAQNKGEESHIWGKGQAAKRCETHIVSLIYIIIISVIDVLISERQVHTSNKIYIQYCVACWSLFAEIIFAFVYV